MVATAVSAAYKLFIGGEWSDAASGRTFEILNPATLEPVATVPDAGPADMQRAIDAAAESQPDWAGRTAAERSKVLMAAAQGMYARSDELARLITLEEGKPLAEAAGEVKYAASFIEWFAEEAKRVYGDTVPASSADKRSWS